MILLTREQVRRVDRLAIEEYGISGLVLMENAGRGVTDLLAQRSPEGPVVICCGTGNNAGDGFVIARHLEIRGIPCRVLLWAHPSQLRGDAAVNFRILQWTDVPVDIFEGHDAARLDSRLDGAAWIVDALLGTGAKGHPRPPLDGVIHQLNAAGLPILAVDLPSGLDCDTGAPGLPTICATETCTFVAMKTGFTSPEAKPYLGAVHVHDIGAPPKIVTRVAGEPTATSGARRVDRGRER
ncbi:MAG: NAD(P)H-hydrate epimerase [Patescibacteria group bacterium]|nr:NAD(P)H-hydrate epimerase [Patescibacteria group bacterium]